MLSVKDGHLSGRTLGVLHVLFNLVEVQVLLDRHAVLVQDAHAQRAAGHHRPGAVGAEVGTVAFFDQQAQAFEISAFSTHQRPGLACRTACSNARATASVRTAR